MSETPFLAIDFGTTNSVMAWINKDGQAELINNREGEAKTPSLVYYGEEGTLVGKYAAAFIEDEMRFLAPDAQQRETARIMRSVKRLIGQSTLIALPGGQMLRPVDVAAEVLKKLKQDAEDGIFHEPLRRAVVTYPAAFDTTQQQAVEQAARQAGFEDVRLLAEPEAAALAYTRLGRTVGEGVLVYDLGGGTFDLSVLRREAEEGMYRLALENEGDARLGGDDIDQLLHDHCLKLAVGQFGADIPAFDINFLYDCRKRKENLSGSMSQTFSNLFNGRPFRHKMERGEFEALIEPLVSRTVRKTQQMLKRAEDAGVKVDTLVLIGGSSRIPLIERRLQEVLPVAPLKFHQADCAVALGAAFYGISKPAPKLVPVPLSSKDLKVATDGSGDFFNLKDALNVVTDGGVIHLLTGEHYLTESLLIEKSVTLLGEGMEVTKIVGGSGEYVIRFSGAGRFEARGIDFRYKGNSSSNVMEIVNGEIYISECRFSDGKIKEKEDGKKPSYGNGLLVSRTVKGHVNLCEMHNNQGVGISVQDQACLELVDNKSVGNYCGIVYYDAARGSATKNYCATNALHGIVIMDHAQPTISNNCCEKNHRHGIIYTDNAGGVARQNLCTFNCTGIFVLGQANPKLEENNSHHNEEGIRTVYTSTPAIIDNNSHDNDRADVIGTRYQQALQFLVVMSNN